MSQLQLPPRTLDAGKEADSGHGRMGPRSEHWREAELFACCITAASSSTLSYWRTHRSSEVAGSEHPRSSMAAAARFWDAPQKSGGTSASALAFVPSLARQSLSHASSRTSSVGARPCG
jgi:hypothetical protein